MAYLRRGCFTIDTGSMSTVRKRGNSGDKKKKREKRNGLKKGREKRRKKKEKGKEIWTGQVLFFGSDDI